MKWWTPDPHPCIGGCGTILQHPWAKRCRKCNRVHAKVRYWERRERGVCVECGKVPAFQGGRLCKVHRELAREYSRKAKAKKRQRNGGIRSSSIARSAALSSERMGMSSTVGPAQSIMAGTYERIYYERNLRRTEEGRSMRGLRKEGFRQRRIGSYCEECSTKKTRHSQANLPRTEEGRTMHAMREGSSKIGSGLLRGMPEGQEAEGDPEEERGVKATIPEGEHPFDYLF